ncbi:MAG: hypothetical protein KAS67_01335 [Thermoplasmata archaeon]|nr:hypothetical protein [Thermoplasmata archaeon]
MVINMVNMTLAIPEDLHEVMKRHTEIKWSEVARKAMWEYAKKLEMLDKMVADSKLKEEDIDEIDHIIKAAIIKHYRKS